MKLQGVMEDNKKLKTEVDAVKYAESVKNEIRKLKKSIDENTRKKKRTVVQCLPRGLRRRTSSYNPKRVPRRIRELAIAKAQEVNKPKKKSCRRKKRRQNEGLLIEKMNDGGNRWLETHIWHAKRAHMKTLWGHKLAIQLVDKKFKRTLSKGLSDCTIHDYSYIKNLEIKGKEETIRAVLGKFEISLPITFWKQEEGLLIEDGFFMGPIGIIKEQISTAGSIYSIWVHCCISKNISDKLKEAQLSITERDFTRFELFGIRSVDRIISVCRLVNRENDAQSKESTRSILEGMEKGSVLAGRCVDPRLGFPKYSTEYGKDTSGIDAIRDTIVLDSSKREEALFNITSEGSLNQRRGLSEVPGTELLYTSEDMPIPILLIKARDGTGWSFVVWNGYGRMFWRCLTYQRTEIVCQNDLRKLFLERGLPLFPYDYAGTEAWRDYMKNVEHENRNREILKPPSKRKRHLIEKNPIENFYKIDRPFFKNIMSKKQLKEMVLSERIMDSTVEEYLKTSIVVFPVLQEGKGTPVEGSQIYKDGNDRTIGVVTSGGFSLTRGRGIGIVSFIAKDIFDMVKEEAICSGLFIKDPNEDCLVRTVKIISDL
eukprot:GHVP01069106.1.p1 GENE.GHVP01069106.1~~GHVP01069106.1.p1  ORF type:complete len:598 (-),score=109.58 GHVP01069106.1:392-2185(-)